MQGLRGLDAEYKLGPNILLVKKTIDLLGDNRTFGSVEVNRPLVAFHVERTTHES